MKKMKVALKFLKDRGIKNVLSYMLYRHSNNMKLPKRLPRYKKILELFSNKYGLEIGGPSNFFKRKGLLPLYPVVKSLDNVNYSPTTVWTGKIDSSSGYIVDNKIMGKQFISDATDLSKIKKRNYDFVLSCNNLEHIANPLRAIEQWLEVLKTGGLLLIIVPKKESNFDHIRKTVKFKHLLDDYEGKITEEDLSHLEEIMEFHDLKLDPLSGTPEDFKKRSLENKKNRCLHHHVFDMDILTNIFEYFNLSILETITIHTDYLIIGKKKD